MDAAYEPKLWQEIFAMLAQAVAALIGLLFVAMSLHVREIIERPDLHARAFNNTFALVMILIVTAACLVPQRPLALGIEIIALNLFFAFAAPLRALPRFLKLRLPIHRPAIALITVLFGAWGGFSLILGKGGGLYVITAS